MQGVRSRVVRFLWRVYRRSLAHHANEEGRDTLRLPFVPVRAMSEGRTPSSSAALARTGASSNPRSNGEASPSRPAGNLTRDPTMTRTCDTTTRETGAIEIWQQLPVGLTRC